MNASPEPGLCEHNIAERRVWGLVCKLCSVCSGPCHNTKLFSAQLRTAPFKSPCQSPAKMRTWSQLPAIIEKVHGTTTPEDFDDDVQEWKDGLVASKQLADSVRITAADA
eukprot:1200317-Lingulodinium_polyedra.AAC.1